MKEYKDLSKPLGEAEIEILSDLIQDDQDASVVLDMILSHGNASTYPSVERLVQTLMFAAIRWQNRSNFRRFVSAGNFF